MKKTIVKGFLMSFVLFTLLESSFAQSTVSSTKDNNIKFGEGENSTHTVRGVVYNDKMETIPWASITIKGKGQSIMTDVNGKFLIAGVTPNDVLVIQSFGYEKKEVEVNQSRNIDIILEGNVQLLNQVVAVGYGTQSSKDVTGSVATVDNESLTKVAAPNAAQQLQGLVPGVVVSNSGAPGSSPSIAIRGIGTALGNSSPLYVVDGMFVDNIAFLNSGDIKDVTVLKDASSAAIYGVRAANGVVIITTKSGKKGTTIVEYTGYIGVQQASHLLPMANNEQYVQFVNELKYNEFLANPSTGAYNYNDPADYPDNTNWFDEVLQVAPIQNHTISIRGGGTSNTYRFGLGYLDQQGIVKKSGYKRINLNLVDKMTVAKWLDVGLNLNMSGYSYQNAPPVLDQAYIVPPVVAPMTDEEYTDPSQYGFGNFANPSATIDYWNSEGGAATMVGNLFADIKFTDWISYKSSFNYELGTWINQDYTPSYYVSATQFDTNQTLSKGTNYGINYIWDNTITFDKKIEEHSIKALAGMSYIHDYSTGLSGSANGIPDYSSSTIYLKNGDATTSQATDNVNKTVSISYFGRINYSYDEKYLLTATLRADGSSVFPQENRWGYFPSVGLGWVASDENFMGFMDDYVDFLKVRASWGLLGNNNIPQNVYSATTTSPTNAAYYTYFGNVVNGSGTGYLGRGQSVTSVVPPNIKWEVVEEYDFGIDAYFLVNRLSLVFDFYTRTTNNALFAVTPSGAIGASGSYYDNNATIRNRGIEFSLGWNDKIGKDVTYNIKTLISTTNNEVISLRPGTTGILSGNVGNGNQATYTNEGHQIGEFWLYEVDGIFQNQQDVLDYTYTNSDGTSNLIMPDAKPGDFRYKDNNNDGVINNDDRIFYGNYATPKVSYSILGDITYKNIDFSFQLQGVAGNKIYNYKRTNRFGLYNVDYDYYKNAWRGEGTSNTYASANISGGLNSAPNTFWVEDGNYFRIRNLTLGYSIGEKYLKKMKIQKLRVYGSIDNVWTFFSYNGFNPEVPFGDVLNAGIDNGVYPLSRVYNVGVQLAF